MSQEHVLCRPESRKEVVGAAVEQNTQIVDDASMVANVLADSNVVRGSGYGKSTVLADLLDDLEDSRTHRLHYTQAE